MLGVVTLAAALVGAPSQSSRIDWVSSQGCPNADWVRERAEIYLGAPLEQPRDLGVQATAIAQKTGSGWSLQLRLATEDGVTEEAHAADDCDELGKLVALKVAVLLDPEAALRAVEEPPPEAEPEPKLEPDPEPEPSPEREPEPRVATPPAIPRVKARVGVFGGLGVAMLPGPGALVGISTAITVGRFRAELAGAYWPPNRIRRQDAADAVARIMAGTITASGCGVPTVEAWSFPLCAGIELGAVRGDAEGVAQASTEIRPSVAFIAAGSAAWTRGRWSLWVRPAAAVGLSRPSFAIEGVGTLHTVGLIGFRGMGGVEVEFP